MSTALQVKADNPRPLGHIIADLSKPIDPQDLESRQQGKATLYFIPWHRAVKYLDRYAPGWSYEVKNIFHLDGRVALVVRISVPCAEGTVYREATGQEEESTSSYGDPTSNAESMALRRAAAKFGLGLYLYDKEKKPGRSGGQPETIRKPDTRDVPRLILHGEQSTQATSKFGKQIMALIGGLKWGAEQVRRWMETEFNYLIETDDLSGFFDSLQNDEQQKIIARLKDAFKNGR